MATRDIRDSILELAITVIDEQGEQAIRTNHIAAEINITPPTLYHYFGSREGLIEAAQAERFFRSLIVDTEILEQQLKTATTKADLLTAVNDLFLRRDDPTRNVIRWKRLNALGSAFARKNLEQRIAAVHNQIVTRAAHALLPFQRQGFIRQDIDVRAVVAWYNGAVLGKSLIMLDGSDIDIEQWERTMNETVYFALFGHSS